MKIRNQPRFVALCLLFVIGFAAKAFAEFSTKSVNWDPVSFFKIQWILNAGHPISRLSINQPYVKTFFLTDGNVIVGKAEIDSDSFYVIQVEQDLAGEILPEEKILIFKRDIKLAK